MMSNSLKLVTFLFSYQLVGCTVAGSLVDGYAKNSQPTNLATTNANQTNRTVTDADGFSFAKLGFEIDSAVIGLLKPEEQQPQLVCRQITRSIKECEEAKSSH
ncbi:MULTISPECIES: hypothetical protein [unclassified Pseudoalteromonas]|uniref:hypothetical protein n=1 Tax=unclassified Pseudoalteromonas TaxID=194690 RepID=UPI000CF6B2E9|nr:MULTISPECIES: hypothetical protein [unclassified Pseudoalteromonas]TMO27448.1 hypothetical protein CWC28_11140 [Pseudoalteromonas sp. S4492]